jgi:hypothetical protein
VYGTSLRFFRRDASNNAYVALQISESGNVGIGVSASERLEVSGNVKVSGDVNASRLCLIADGCISSWSDVGSKSVSGSGGGVVEEGW